MKSHACPCCGRNVDDSTESLWCVQCLRHVIAVGRLDERTYFGQHRVACPFALRNPIDGVKDRWRQDPSHNVSDRAARTRDARDDATAGRFDDELDAFD